MEGTTYLNPNYEIFKRKMELNHFYRSFVLASTAWQLVILHIGKCGGGFMDLGVRILNILTIAIKNYINDNIFIAAHSTTIYINR